MVSPELFGGTGRLFTDESLGLSPPARDMTTWCRFRDRSTVDDAVEVPELKQKRIRRKHTGI